MLYKELKEKGKEFSSGSISGAYRTADTMIEAFKYVYPESTRQAKFLESMKRYIIENMENYGMGGKTERQCKKITEQTKKEIMDMYNVDENIKIYGLGIK